MAEVVTNVYQIDSRIKIQPKNKRVKQLDSLQTDEGGHTHTHTHTYTHARTHTNSHTHTHTGDQLLLARTHPIVETLAKRELSSLH